MNNKVLGTLTIGAAVFVLFLAILNPVDAVFFSVAALTALGVYLFYEIKEKVPGNLVEWYVADREKKKNLILDEIRKKGGITNNDVEKITQVSDATATRYLEDLERAGMIKQEGKSGRSVKYVLCK